MATQSGQTDPAVNNFPDLQIRRYSFFRLVYLLERYAGGAPLGYRGPASAEAMRLKPTTSMGFSASDLVELNKLGGEGAPGFELVVSCLGLYGTVSPLPNFYCEDILWEEPDNPSVRDFLDIFHHRLLSLLYRSWKKYRYYVEFQPGGGDKFSRQCLSLIGLNNLNPPRNGGIPAINLLRYAGMLTLRTCSADALESILKDYFATPEIRITQCVERWCPVPPEQRNSLGQQNCRLGEDLAVGERVYTRSGRFRIDIGPLNYADFTGFLPDGANLKSLKQLIRTFLRDRLEPDLELWLHAGEVPPLRLSADSPARLGWTSWLAHGGTENVGVLFDNIEQGP